MEMSCDEAVLKVIGKERKKEYSTSLLSFAVEKHIVGGTPVAFGEGDTRSRIKNVLNYRKPTVLLVGVTLVICIVCGIVLLANPREDEQSEQESQSGSDERQESEGMAGTETESEEQPEIQTGPFGYMGYTGYMDECSTWISAWNDFESDDYDADGLYDRVYRTKRENTEFCHYRIEFGNGEILSFEKAVSDVGTPAVRSVDLTGDGENEIIFSLSYGMSTDPSVGGDMVVYEKVDSAYRKVKFPFEESETGYEQMLEIIYDKAKGHG